MKLTVLVLATLLLAGCGGASDAPTMAKVAGVANFNGTPLPDATVTFYPEKGQPGVGRTDAAGAFQIRTNGQLGAIVSKHKVTVAIAPASTAPVEMDGNEMNHAQATILPSKYGSVETTDLQIDVPAAGNPNLTLDLTP